MRVVLCYDVLRGTGSGQSVYARSELCGDGDIRGATAHDWHLSTHSG